MLISRDLQQQAAKGTAAPTPSVPSHHQSKQTPPCIVSKIANFTEELLKKSFVIIIFIIQRLFIYLFFLIDQFRCIFIFREENCANIRNLVEE